MRRKRIILGLVLAVCTGLSSITRADDAQQVAISATPVRVQLASSTPAATELSQATSTPTRTPTPQGAALLEAKADAGAVNVRAEPDPNSDKLGAIRAGEKYTILGRYFEWYQFQYDPSPNKMGWVFGQLVDVIGDATTIQDLNPNLQPTVDTGVLNLTQTWEAITQAPGGILTATAQARVIAAPGSGVLLEITAESNSSGILPTFTYPPDIPPQAPSPNPVGEIATTINPNAVANPESQGIAPIVPILALAGLGILGLVVSSLRK